MLIILLKIFFGLAILAALGLSISILISIISDHRISRSIIRQVRRQGKVFKVEGNYDTKSYQYE